MLLLLPRAGLQGKLWGRGGAWTALTLGSLCRPMHGSPRGEEPSRGGPLRGWDSAADGAQSPSNASTALAKEETKQSPRNSTARVTDLPATPTYFPESAGATGGPKYKLL